MQFLGAIWERKFGAGVFTAVLGIDEGSGSSFRPTSDSIADTRGGFRWLSRVHRACWLVRSRLVMSRAVGSAVLASRIGPVGSTLVRIVGADNAEVGGSIPPSPTPDQDFYTDSV
jgi:hypothetical protein